MLKSYTVATTVTGDKFRNFIFFFFMMLYLDCLLHPGIYTKSSYSLTRRFQSTDETQYVETLVRRLTFFYSFCVRNFFFRNDSWHSPTEYHPQQSSLTSPTFFPHVWVYLCICMYVNPVFFQVEQF